MSPSFKGKVAFVTGGASGMGLAIAQRLAELGARVAIADINLEAAQKAAASIGKACIALRVNVAEESTVQLAIAEVEKQYGRLDLVANSAGVQLDVGPLVTLTTENIARTLDINLKGLIFCLKYELGLMKKNGSEEAESSTSPAPPPHSLSPSTVLTRHPRRSRRHHQIRRFRGIQQPHQGQLHLSRIYRHTDDARRQHHERLCQDKHSDRAVWRARRYC